MGKKALEELVFHDDFMFAAVMMDAENCRCFLERVLEMISEHPPKKSQSVSSQYLKILYKQFAFFFNCFLTKAKTILLTPC